VAIFSLEEASQRCAQELVAGDSPDRAYDRAWALTVVSSALERVREECDRNGPAGRFHIVRNFLEGDRGEVPFAEAARMLGLSMPAAKSLVHRLRQRFGTLIRQEIRETLRAPDDVEDELQALFAALGR
jgi:RNA polymerase sigma-70 factor (ECF subfamily)